eukprot:CAMPEP_0171042638 /NCGR_PEP_ID=MMETSP0736-20130129/46461_1 /TAXON_ID=186038 /ORGANISM="Fragilariopsis kerguelensis, Strain L26-C5" /LENGTH=292 /DNA_ID=CAMNT_0011491331 /DNA_START=585 /DNA_END=1463 /DNA_ORIENTATION=-
MIMYGPLTLAAYLSIYAVLWKGTGGTVTSKTFGRKTTENGGIIVVLQAVVVFGLGFLSIAPHQEPRFLLPLIIPLVLLGDGILHQGGVTKSLLAVGSTAIQSQQIQPTSWIYWRTYMPPTFLTRFSRDIVDDSRTCKRLSTGYNDDEKDLMSCEQTSFVGVSGELDEMCQKSKVRIVDLHSSSLEKLWGTIQTKLPCASSEGIFDPEAFLFLVVPFLAENSDSDDKGYNFSTAGQEGRCQLPNKTYECDHIRSYGPHLTTEDFPPYPYDTAAVDFYNRFVLNVFKISCSTKG